MRILAIDPGYERLGVAVLEKIIGEKETLLFSECFKTSPKETHPDRLAKIQKEVERVIKKYKPIELSIETLFFNKNVKTAMFVAEARGVIIATSRNCGLEIHEYSPQEIKISVTGNGRSDKTSVIKMVPLLISIESGVKIDDEFDAIATGICHLSKRNLLA